MTADITVQLASGTYRLTTPLTMDSRDSGTNGHNVVWTAAPGASPVISGGQQISGWTLTDPTKNIWTAPAPAGLQTRQLYVNGVRAQRAMGNVPVTLTQTSTGYTASDSTMSTWRNPSGLEFVNEGGDKYWSRGWSSIDVWDEIRCPVASISGTTITMAQPCWNNSTQRPQSPTVTKLAVNLVGHVGLVGLPSYVENAYELMDQPGEWYYDTSAHTISYIPRTGENLSAADVEAPALENLVVGNGTAAAPISNIVFSGIQFSYATWNAPSSGDGFSEIQANYRITGTNGASTQGLCALATGGTCPYGAWTKEPGNLTFSYAHNLQFRNDVFVHLGAAGLDLGDGAQNNTVRDCVFTDISGNGMELGGVDNPQPSAAIDYTNGNQILDNHLYALPVEYHGGVAIDVGYSENTLISHNQLDHLPYSGISIGWGGWLDKAQQAPQPNYSNHNVISDNLIFDVMNRLEDGGAIYSNGTTGTSYLDGEQEIGNVAHDALNANYGYYTDNGSDWVTLTGNTSYNGWHDDGSAHLDYNPGATTTYDPTLTEANFWSEYNSQTNFTQEANRLISAAADAPPSTVANAGLQSADAAILTQNVGINSVPDAPDDAAAFAANGAAYVGFAPSYVENGSPVTSYTVTASPGGQSATINASDYMAKPYVMIPGLTNGTAYTFSVTAKNANGTSAPSRSSAAITPTAGAGAVPAAPTHVHVTMDALDDRAAVTWTVPTTTGDTPIIGYTVSAPGLPTQTLTDRNAIARTSWQQVFFNGLKPGTSYTFTVTAQNAVGSSPAGTGTVTFPAQPALSTAYSNAGISTDGTAGDANIDGYGYSLSAQALASAGVTPGSSVTAGGQTFTWPNTTPTSTPATTAATLDNVVASGQTVTVPSSGSGSTLGFLATSTSGATSGTGTIRYTDGTTQPYTLAVPDWYSNPPAGSTVAIAMNYRNTPTGAQSPTHVTSVYYVSVPLQAGKTVASVTLPNISAVPDKGVATMHIFAATIS